MTKINPIYPKDFKKIEYTAYWQEIEHQFKNSFGNLKLLTVNIRIITAVNGEQTGFDFDENNNIGTLDISFVRYWNNEQLSALSTPREFYVYVESVLNRVAKDFN
jgi:hypothetical protein